MNDDPKAQRLREGYQPKRDALIRSNSRSRSHAFDGYEPKHDELTKGYPVTQPVNLANLKIPQNLGTAAVTPVNRRNTAPASATSEKH
ncbi:MAG: hypothetical protein ACRD3O_08895 [Terriglobia bacterium]